MLEEAISIVQADISKDLYDMVACHREEVSRIMQEFDKHDIDTSVQFDAYEAERRSQTPSLGAPVLVAPSPQPSIEDTQQSTKSDDDEEDMQQPEPSLFDILQDDVEYELDEDLPLEHQE